VDEKEILQTQIKAYEFYAGLIERAVGGGALARLPRWDEQRALEYRELAAQLRRRLAELEEQEPAQQEPLPPNGEENGAGATADVAPAASVPSGESASATRG
jgi:hypothetical protein